MAGCAAGRAAVCGGFTGLLPIGWTVLEIWLALRVTGLSFTIPQFLSSNFIGPELMHLIAALVSMVCRMLFLRLWQPAKIWSLPAAQGQGHKRRRSQAASAAGSA